MLNMKFKHYKSLLFLDWVKIRKTNEMVIQLIN